MIFQFFVCSPEGKYLQNPLVWYWIHAFWGNFGERLIHFFKDKFPVGDMLHDHLDVLHGWCPISWFITNRTRATGGYIEPGNGDYKPISYITNFEVVGSSFYTNPFFWIQYDLPGRCHLEGWRNPPESQQRCRLHCRRPRQ